MGTLSIIEKRSPARAAAMSNRVSTIPAKLIKTLLAATVIAAVAAVAAHANPDKVGYELADRCAKSSQALFKSKYAAMGNGGVYASFQNHYNPKLNGCFMVITSVSFTNQYTTHWISLELLNVNENRALSQFTCRGDGDNKNGIGQESCAIGHIRLSAAAPFTKSMRFYMER
jgi:hypothetical protein